MTVAEAQTPGPQALLAAHYDACFAAHGRTPRGVDWPNAEDLAVRFDVLLEMTRGAGLRPALLDLGCGPGLLLDHLQARGRLDAVDYQGVDLSPAMIASAEAAWPGRRFAVRDILAAPLAPLSVDVAVLNGVLTERREAGVAAMRAYALDLLEAAFRACRVGLSFNVMSPRVDWERDDLFHWPFDDMTAAVGERLSRHIAVRADYGLYEYAVFVRRQPLRG